MSQEQGNTPWDQEALDRASWELQRHFGREGSLYGIKACEEIARIAIVAYGRAMPSETARSEGYPGIAHDLETMRTALLSIAIVDDADCAHASDHEAMKKIARDALRGVK